MVQTIKNYIPWQEYGSSHIREKVHANKVPIKFKKCAALHNLEPKKKATRITMEQNKMTR
jgi:hypothetical protein